MHFGRNVHFTVKNGKLDEFSRLMTGEVLPLLKTQKGFCQEATLLGRNNTGMSVSVWDDRTCEETYNTKTYPVILKKLEPVLDGPPRVETYDTVLALTPKLIH